MPTGSAIHHGSALHHGSAMDHGSSMQHGSVMALVACGFPCVLQMPNNWLRMMRFMPFPGITIPLLFYCPDGITTVLHGHGVGGIFIDALTSVDD